MEHIDFQWLHDETSFKEAIQSLLGSSGQTLKKYYSSKQLGRPIRSRDLMSLPLDLVNHMRINPHYEGPEISIIEDNPHFLALHKPANIHCHPHSYSDKNTLLNFLAQNKMWEPLLVNVDNYDRGLLYRLDFETSGIMILAKDNGTLLKVREDFHKELKRKFYWVIVNGSFNQEGRWSHFFKASGPKGSKQKVLDTQETDTLEGSLSVLKVSEREDKSLLLVNLKTGLRHQIRAQLSHLGFPILGDTLYGGIHDQRLFLHAFRYEWTHTLEDPHADGFERYFDIPKGLDDSRNLLSKF